MGFYVTGSECERREKTHPPSKNRVWDFFATSHTCAGQNVTFAQYPRPENEPTPTATASGARYYGYRFYSPSLGRWISRDPAEEAGGHNLYVPVDNAPINKFDYLGLIDANSSIAEIEAEVRKLIAAARAKGMNVAADNLQNFLNGGGDRALSATWLRGFNGVLDAERRNQKRFERDLKKIARKMKNGETKRHQDYWDALISYGGRGFSTEELFWASGDSTLSSHGDFSLTASACEVKISGDVDHNWFDTYDWHPGLSVWIPGFGNIPDAAIDKLRTQGSASNFKMKSTWRQHLGGTVQIYFFGLFSDAEWNWTGP